MYIVYTAGVLLALKCAWLGESIRMIIEFVCECEGVRVIELGREKQRRRKSRRKSLGMVETTVRLIETDYPGTLTESRPSHPFGSWDAPPSSIPTR